MEFYVLQLSADHNEWNELQNKNKEVSLTELLNSGGLLPGSSRLQYLLANKICHHQLKQTLSV